MKNIIILYNPYYQDDVIEQHLEILKDKGSVAFGKIKSKIRDYEHPNEEVLDSIYDEVSRDNPMQLFLTDYNSIYVAHVIAVKTDKTRFIKAPSYYDTMEVEKWYVIDDLRLIVEDDFKNIRDNILPNFRAINYNNHTYAIYGNKYVYPMQISMKENINYFEKDNEDFKYYNDIFKSELESNIKKAITVYVFTEDMFYKFASNTQDNIISAELEYIQNKHNPLYDFSAVVIKYSKAVELELHRFFKILFAYLSSKKPSLNNIEYSIQGRNYLLEDMQECKANYGTYKYLLNKNDIRKSIDSQIKSSEIRYFISKTIPKIITIMQNIRNESVHGGTTSLQECNDIRNNLLGINCISFLGTLILYKKEF